MHLVHRHRARMPAALLLLPFPVCVTPAVARRAGDQAGRPGPVLAGPGKGIRLDVKFTAAGMANFELVPPVLQARDEQLPDALASVTAHRMKAPVPFVEIPDHAGPSGIRRPNCEQGACDAVHRMRPGAQHVLRIAVVARVEGIHLGGVKLRPETVGIDEFGSLAAVRRPDNPVVVGYFARLCGTLEKIGSGHPRHRARFVLQPRFPGARQEATEHFEAIDDMAAQDRKRISVRAFGKTGDVRRVDGRETLWFC